VLTKGNDVPVGAAVDGDHRYDMNLVRATIVCTIVARTKSTEERP